MRIEIVVKTDEHSGGGWTVIEDGQINKRSETLFLANVALSDILDHVGWPYDSEQRPTPMEPR